MSVSKIKATVFSQEQLASDVFSMWLEVGSIASEASRDSLSLSIRMTTANCFQDQSVSVKSTGKTAD